jgi:peptidoglycan DL-endopeptidase CwlO
MGRLRILMALLACALLSSAGTVSSAHADPLLDHKQAQLARLKRQIHALDLRVDRLDQRYDAAVIRTRTLARQIPQSTRALQAAAARLRTAQAHLADLLVAAYKGQMTDDSYALVIGSPDLGSAINTYETRARFDAAVAGLVAQIADARAAIIARRRELRMEHHDAAEAAQQLDAARQSIRHSLRLRRRLARSLGKQILVATAAERVGQEELALRARRWITADLRGRRRLHKPVDADMVALGGLAEIGVPYQWGGASPSTGFDCSGLVTWLWAREGVTLPHLASAQYAAGLHVSVAGLEIGDLLFFHKLGHVAIYLGHGYVLHAPHTGDVVRIASLSDPWFVATFVGAARVEE